MVRIKLAISIFIFTVFFQLFTRNVYSEKSKADDVQFILDLIAKIGAEIPEADMNNVNIAGNIIM